VFVATIIVGVVLALAFLGAGTPKIVAMKQMRDSAEHFGLSINAYRVIGALEVAAAAGLLIGLGVAALGVAAAIGLVALMIGALIFHVRAGDPAKMWAPVPVLAVLAVVYIVLRLASR